MGDDEVLIVWIELHGEMATNEGGELFGASRFGRYVPHARRMVIARGDDAATDRAMRRAHNDGPMTRELSDQRAVRIPTPAPSCPRSR